MTSLPSREIVLEPTFPLLRLLDSVLNESDIPHRMRSYYDTVYDGLFQAQKGWGYVSAPASHREEILEIIADLGRANPHRRWLLG
jgi:hypothetical protein